MDTCPPLEEIAAFLDGTLSPEDRERITTHLASCESCYEIFAGVVHFQEAERTGTLPPPPEHSEWINSFPRRPGARYVEVSDQAFPHEAFAYKGSVVEAEAYEAEAYEADAAEVADWIKARRAALPSLEDLPNALRHTAEPRAEEAPRSRPAVEADRTGVLLPRAPATEQVRPRASGWLPLAASVLLVSVLGFAAWEFLAPSKMVLADVVKPLEQEENISDLLYADTTRGVPPPGDTLSMRPHFMAGVYLLDLRLSVQAEDVERTATRLQGLALSLQEIPLLPNGLAEEYEKEFQRMKTPSDLARLMPDLPAREAEIQEAIADHPAFQLGLWTEAARLSALTESPEFFDRRKNSRFLSRLLKEEALPVPPALHETVVEYLRTVRSAWDLSPRNYQVIAENLRTIIRVIDQYEEEDFSPGN